MKRDVLLRNEYAKSLVVWFSTTSSKKNEILRENLLFKDKVYHCLVLLKNVVQYFAHENKTSGLLFLLQCKQLRARKYLLECIHMK